MIVRIRIIVLALLLPFSSSVEAQYGKEDFAFGFGVEIDGAGAVYSIPVPYEVYSSTVQKNLGDVRMFNSEGEMVPHEFRYAQLQDERFRTMTDVPYFPLASEQGVPADDLMVEIRKSKSGEIVSIEKRTGSGQSPAQAYLLDVGNVGPYPVTLRLQWKTEGVGVLVPITLEGSRDLVSWRKVAESTLADLEFMGNRLHNGEVTLVSDPGKYLRLLFGPRGEAVRITSIKAITEPLPASMERNWVDLPLQRQTEQGKKYLKGELGGALPVDSLQFGFPRPNSILQARIYTRNSNEPWRFRGNTLFYDLLENSVRLRNDPLSIPRENVRFFRLEVVQDGMGEGDVAPKLQVGYIPHDLIFIARGTGPFVLAYGNGSMKNGERAEERAEFHGLIGEKNKSIVRSAELGEKMVLGGEQRLVRSREPPWKKIVLWGVLLAGVVVLAVMAWTLTRRMDSV